MLKNFLALADETAKFLRRLFGTSNAAKTEITQLKEELQSLIDQVGKSEEKAQRIFKPLENLSRKIDEISLRDDVSATGPITTKVAGQEPLDDLLLDLSKKTGADPDEIRKVLADDVNLGYESGSPKRLDPNDDESLKAYIQTQKLMNREDDLIDIIRENADMTPTNVISPTFSTFRDLGKTDVGIPEPKGTKIDRFPNFPKGEADDFGRPPSVQKRMDEMLEKGEDAIKELERKVKKDQERFKAAEEFMTDPKNFDKMTQPGGLAKILKEVDEDKAKVVDLAEFRRRKKDPLDDDDFAMGGRVHAKLGMFAGIGKKMSEMFGDEGLIKILFDKVAGMRRADRVADKEQAKNIMRDPDTDLERIGPMTDDEGNIIQRATPEGKMTIRDLEDLPRELFYENPELRQFEKFIEREKVRAILADRMGVEPKDIPEENIDMALRDLKFFAMGGGVGSLFKERTR